MKFKTIVTLLIIFIVLIGISVYPLIQQKRGATVKNPDNINLPFHSFSSDSVSEINIKKGVDNFTLMKDGNLWQIASFSASKSKIDSLFSAFQETNVDHLVSKNNSNQEQYGIASDSGIFITMKTSSGDKKFVIGKEGTKPDSFYAKKDGDVNVYLVNGPLAQALFTSVSNWRDKTVINVPISNIKTIDVTGNLGFSLLKTDKGNWELSKQGTKKVIEDAEVTKTLNYVSPLEGSDFTNDVETKEFGNEKTQHIVFKDKDQKVLGDVVFLNKDAYYWVNSDANSYVQKVAGYKLDDFLKLASKI